MEAMFPMYAMLFFYVKQLLITYNNEVKVYVENYYI